jgi:hypothetical protein
MGKGNRTNPARETSQFKDRVDTSMSERMRESDQFPRKSYAPEYDVGYFRVCREKFNGF